MPDSSRTRTFSWPDPTDIVATARGKSGVELLRALQGARSAPVAATLDFALVEVDEGRVVFELAPAEFHENPIGSVHGGVLATLLDSATGAAVHSRLPAGSGYTTLEIKVSFIKAVTRRVPLLRAEGRVVSLGARVATAEATLRDAAGMLYATATSTCLILS